MNHTTGAKATYGKARTASKPVEIWRVAPFQALSKEYTSPDG
jgi:hypothetical protein